MWPFTKRLNIPDGALVPTAPAALAGDRVVSGDRLENVAAGLNTPRDKRFYNRYMLSPQATRDELEEIYNTSWVGGRIVTTVAQDMMRAGWTVSWKNSAKQQDQQRALKDAAVAYLLEENIIEGLLWSRLFGGAATIFFFRGDTLKDLARPLDMRSIKKGSLLNFVTRDRWWIAGTGNPDPNPGPNFGKPEFYMLSDAGTISSTTSTG